MKNKTFLSTLLLFLISFNIGILIICVSTFKNVVNRTEESSLDEHYFIASSIIKDFSSVQSRGIDIESSLQELLQPYSHLLQNKKSGMALYKNNQLVYSNKFEIVPDQRFLNPKKDGSRTVSLQKSGSRTYAVVSGRLSGTYNAYTIIYIYNMTDSVMSWRHMKNKLFFAGLFLSILFASFLLLLLNKIFRPLKQISETSCNIANGEYETRLTVSGHDELSYMAQNFNHMADKIEHQMSELTSAAEKKQQFIDNFAHEMRTPITAIYGYAEYIQKAAITEDDRLFAASYIMSESKRLQTMAHQLLELANLKNNKIIFKKQNVPCLFQSIKQTLYKKIAEKEIKIEFDCEINTIWGNAYLLESLFSNLIDNAIKACNTGGHIIVRAVFENGYKTFYIKDNGKGMTPEVLKHITEPFYRGEKSRSRSDGGSGLGLAICSQIALCHSAKLNFTSQPGKGTTVKITFTTSK